MRTNRAENGYSPVNPRRIDPAKLEKLIRSRRNWTCRMLAAAIKKKFDVDYSSASASIFLRSFGVPVNPLQNFRLDPAKVRTLIRSREGWTGRMLAAAIEWKFGVRYSVVNATRMLRKFAPIYPARNCRVDPVKVKQLILSRKVWTGQSLADAIEWRFGVRYTRGYACYILRKLTMRSSQ
jgi:transposase